MTQPPATSDAPTTVPEHPSVLGHELRTPLTAIVGFASMLRDECVDGDPGGAERADKLDLIIDNAGHLLRLIEGMLECARAGQGRLAPVLTGCSPWRVAADTLRSLSGLAAAKGLALALDASGPVPKSLVTDPHLLRQVLLNLLGNAIRYTRQGGVRVIIGMHQDHLRLSVVDTGPGMSTEQVQRLFHPYERAGRGLEPGSSGLGLWISRQLALQLRGRLTVATAPEAGSAFHLDLPFQEGSAPFDDPSGPVPLLLSGADQAANLPKGELAGLRVLVVDDVETNQLLLSVLFKRHGAGVMIAADGAAGMAAVQQAERDGRPFDLVMMDIRMPVMDGCEATTRLRAEGCRRAIVACSANMDAEDLLSYATVGFDGFLPKPITMAHFLPVVMGAIRARRALGS